MTIVAMHSNNLANGNPYPSFNVTVQGPDVRAAMVIEQSLRKQDVSKQKVDTVMGSLERASFENKLADEIELLTNVHFQKSLSP